MFRSRNIVVLVVLVSALLWSVADSKAQQDALAIFNLTPTNMEAMGYDGEILYALISVLEREKTIELMPRREMEEVLFQAGLIQGGDAESIVKAGKALGITYVLYGNVTKKGGRILATLKLMDVQQKRLINCLRPFRGHLISVQNVKQDYQIKLQQLRIEPLTEDEAPYNIAGVTPPPDQQFDISALNMHPLYPILGI